VICVHQHRERVTASSGSVTSTTLGLKGGILRHVIVRADTDTTVFRMNLADDKGLVAINYPYHVGEINDWDVAIPVAHGRYTINITNSSPDDTFEVYLGIEE